jgi:hypothetical protein
MSLDMLMTLLVDIIAPLIAADSAFFGRATLRIYLALDRRVSCNEIAAYLARQASDLGRKRLKHYADREQIIFNRTLETLLPEVHSGQITIGRATKIVIAMTGGERDGLDVQEAVVQLQEARSQN